MRDTNSFIYYYLCVGRVCLLNVALFTSAKIEKENDEIIINMNMEEIFLFFFFSRLIFIDTNHELYMSYNIDCIILLHWQHYTNDHVRICSCHIAIVICLTWNLDHKTGVTVLTYNLLFAKYCILELIFLEKYANRQELSRVHIN